MVQSERLNRNGGNFGIVLPIQLGLDGSGLGISLYAQLDINGLFDFVVETLSFSDVDPSVLLPILIDLVSFFGRESIVLIDLGLFLHLKLAKN